MHDGKKTEKKTAVTRRRKVLLYWSRADAEMAVRKRARCLAKTRSPRYRL